MSKSLSLPRRLGHVARMLAAFAGSSVAEWSPRPPLPASKPPRSFRFPGEVTLWHLPVGLVRIRERHRALPPELAEVDDRLRFPVMMSDNRLTGWLECSAWLIEHPECCILVDTGESANFGKPDYFGDAATRMARIYPKIIDATAAPRNDLASMIALTGQSLSEIDLCVLTHTHSDHVGNLDMLAKSTRLLVSPEELIPAARSGRLLGKLPQDGRIQQTSRTLNDPIFGPIMPLTQRGDVFAIATPGHTVGHQSVVIDLGDRRIIIAGDCAFDDDQLAYDTIPGIIEDRSANLKTYALLRRAQLHKPTMMLFTHDPTNSKKLAEFAERG